DLQRREAELDTQMNRLRAEASVDAHKLRTETPLVESRVLTTRPYQQAIVEVNQRLAEARARGLAQEHPDVRQLNSKLAQLRRLASAAEHGDDTEVERSRNPIYESTLDNLQRLRAAEEATRKERERLKEDFARVQGIVDKLPQL